MVVLGKQRVVALLVTVQVMILLSLIPFHGEERFMYDSIATPTIVVSDHDDERIKNQEIEMEKLQVENQRLELDMKRNQHSMEQQIKELQEKAKNDIADIEHKVEYLQAKLDRKGHENENDHKEVHSQEVVEYRATHVPRVTHVPVYAPSNETVLGMISPPGIHGGYRNQVLRLLGFVTHALKNNIKYILLDSIVCVTPDKASPAGRDTIEFVPFASLFDVDHWNTFHDHLPQLVDYHESSDYNCWKKGDEEADAMLKNKDDLSGSKLDLIRQGDFLPLFNTTRDIYAGIGEPFGMSHLRKTSVPHERLARKANCIGRPLPYGAGSAASRLWRETSANLEEETKTGKFPFNAMANVHKALRPNKKWRDLTKSCVRSKDDTRYLGVHLRIEPEMLQHKCSFGNEMNLTKIFLDIDEFLLKHNEDISVIALATSRKDLEDRDKVHQQGRVIADENLEKFNRLTTIGSRHNIGGKDASVIECGQKHVDKYFDKHPDEKEYGYGVLLPMVINFEMLIEADIFIGVRGSSYSNDIWISRYHNGKGLYNYEYTTDGIIPIGNGGLPSPFKCV